MSISASPGRLSCGSSLLAGGPLCIILGALCFSTTGTVQALAPDGSHPLGIGALRMQIGALALWAWCACRHSLPAGLRHWQLRWLIPATLGLLGFQVFFFWGVQQAGVAVGTVTAIGFSPVMAAILARIILGERPARIWYPATGLALAGLVLLNLGSSQDTSTAALLLPLLAGPATAPTSSSASLWAGPTRRSTSCSCSARAAGSCCCPSISARRRSGCCNPRGWGWPCIWAS